jgi:hypothetical protein
VAKYRRLLGQAQAAIHTTAPAAVNK